MTEISPALRRRLPVYFRTLIRLYGKGKERVSSEELARELDLVPSQVRTDMKAIGCIGQRSYGYGIPTLYKKIADILQLSDKFSAVIVGSSHLAKAIAEDAIFAKRGVKLSAVFSDRAEGFDLLPKCAVLPISSLNGYLQSSSPDIIILACEAEVADEALRFAECEAEAGGNAPEIWNFTDAELGSEILKVKNIHMSDYLMLLCLDCSK